MKKVLKWIGIVLGSLVGLILVLSAVFYFMGNARLNKTYDIPADNIAIPTDPASIENGSHRVQSMCIGCHGEDLSGITDFTVVGPIMTLDSANLTSGKGGVGQEFTSDEDYVRAIRHGVGPDGKPNFMPAVVSFQYISDDDLGAIVAYLKTVPPVDHETHGFQVTALGKILIGAGIFGKLPVESVSHASNVTAPAVGVSTGYGEYLVNISGCHDCHGPELAGGPFPDPSVKMISPNLTPGGELASWSEQDFLTTIRGGVTPGGHQLNPDLMPWKEISGQTDDELKAIFMYLQSLSKLPQYTE